MAVPAGFILFLTPIVLLWIVVGLRAMSLLKFKRFYIGFILVLCLLVFSLGDNIANIFVPTDTSFGRILKPITEESLSHFWTRKELEEFLLAKNDKHVVIVKYMPTHNFLFEWVYNKASIDQSNIVWARDMGEIQNKRLLEYFKDRQVWYVEVGWLEQQSFNTFTERSKKITWINRYIYGHFFSGQ